MKITAFGDFQGFCKKVSPSLIPTSDMFLVPGDITTYGDEAELHDFNEWLGKLPHKYKVVVAGNHEYKPVDIKKILTNAIYLQDELLEVEGIKIWGSPVSEMNEFLHTSDFVGFCGKSYIDYACKQIPEGIDILLTHGCPYGILDKVERGSVGSPDILKAVERTKPKYHVFGHIHQGYGQIEQKGVQYINAAACDEYNRIVDKKGNLLHQPIVFEI